jgi:4-hydroxy-tetrahydrodipicolinate synthase
MRAPIPIRPPSMTGPSLLAAALTPVDPEGAPDAARLHAHAARLLADGCDGVVLFGTTGEGPAFREADRRRSLERLLADGLPPERVMVATAALPFPEVVAATRAALALGCAAVLVMPLFFLREADDDDLFRFYAAMIEAVGHDRPWLYLYNIPSVAGLSLGEALIRRLIERFPGVIAGIKDSSIDWPTSRRLIEAFPEIPVLVGAEHHLPDAVAHGGAGTICGMANIVPGLVRRLLEGERGLALQAIEALIDRLERPSFVAALKAVIAVRAGDDAWTRACPPLRALSEEEAAALVRDVDRLIAAAGPVL